MSDEHYREQIARLAQRAQESALADQYNEALQLDREMQENWAAAVEYDREGDDENANFYAKEANAKAAELQQALAKMPQQPQQLSETKLKWLRQRQDLVAHPHFEPLANFYHQWVTQNMGVQEDSPAYVELMSKALEPANYQPTPTPDDIVHELATNSKVANLGGRFTGADYNRGVNQLINAKRNGYV